VDQRYGGQEGKAGTAGREVGQEWRLEKAGSKGRQNWGPRMDLRNYISKASTRISCRVERQRSNQD
jgi:hypothetical protein